MKHVAFWAIVSLVGCGTAGGAPPDSGAGTDAGADSGSPDGGGARTCADLLTQYSTLMGQLQSCDDQHGCALTTRPLPELPPFCSQAVIRAGVDESELAALAAAWTSQKCQVPGTVCGGFPANGVPTCVSGRCDALAPCALCPTDYAPVCTTSGLNAINACTAEQCLGSTVADAGACSDTVACVDRGGTCVESPPGTPGTTPPCPSGKRYDASSPVSSLCAAGQFPTTCCEPWDAPCPYLAWTLNLSKNPFTCADTGNVCLHPRGEVTRCTATWDFFAPFSGADPNVTLQVSVAEDGRVSVTGINSDTGRTFTCTGEIWWSALSDDSASWQCEACLGTDCTTCSIEQSVSCSV